MAPDGSETVAILAQIPLFRDFTLGELHRCAAIGSEQGSPAGRILGVGGERLQSMWILLDGRLAVHSPLANGRPTYLDSPSVWGVSALIPPGLPQGTAVTATDCRLLQVPAAALRQLCDNNPRFGRRMYEAIAVHVMARLATIIEADRS